MCKKQYNHICHDTGASRQVWCIQSYLCWRSVVSSSIWVDSAYQNQKQSHDDLTNSNHSNAIEISENDKVSIEGWETVKTENVILAQFTRINLSMPLDSSMFQRLSSRVRKIADTFILSDINTQKSNQKAQMVSDEHWNFLSLKTHHQSMKGIKLSNLSSVMFIRAYIMQCIIFANTDT